MPNPAPFQQPRAESAYRDLDVVYWHGDILDIASKWPKLPLDAIYRPTHDNGVAVLVQQLWRYIGYSSIRKKTTQ
jgi:hypothetical protein